MRRARCERCHAAVPFDAQSCRRCRTSLGYVASDRTVRALDPTDDPAVHHTDDGRSWWRCLNAAWGCNWMVPAAAGDVWCRSCRLTRGRPDEERPDAVRAWMTAEGAKRRLVHQLDTLALPIVARSPDAPDGLAFDLVHLDDASAVTGHADGVVTLDLAEADDAHRDLVREQLSEQYRTVIGHLRHEIGHHYWNRLVGQSDHLPEFRRLFGDEREDYGAAIEAHYANGAAHWDPEEFITAYASAHPVEDWAETFAHYLHIVDVVDTADSHGLLVPGGGAPAEAVDIVGIEFAAILDRWRPVNEAMDDIAASLGSNPLYPFEPAGAVIGKLAFVHARVVANSRRDRFYAVN